MSSGATAGTDLRNRLDQKGFTSVKFTTIIVNKTISCSHIVRRDYTAFSAQWALDNRMPGCLHQPRIVQRVIRWHTDGSVQADVTPFSVSTAPRSSDPRFRPSRKGDFFPQNGRTLCPAW